MKILVYSNKNLPRLEFFRVRRFAKCIVFMFKMFDVSLWWGDSHQDMDYQGKV